MYIIAGLGRKCKPGIAGFSYFGGRNKKYTLHLAVFDKIQKTD